MDYAIYDAWRAGVARVIFVIRSELEAEFRTALGRRYAPRLEVVYALQELADLPDSRRAPEGRRKPWGTAQAVLAARAHIGGPFIVMNADDYYGAGSFARLVEHLRMPVAGAPECHALVAYRLRDTLSAHGAVSRAVCETDENDLLQRITEYTHVELLPEGPAQRGPNGLVTRFTGQERVSMNLWGFRPSVLARIESGFGRFLVRHGDSPDAEYYLPTAVGELLDQGQVCVQVLDTSSTWFGLTHHADRAVVAQRIAALVGQGTYPHRLWD